MRGDSGALTQFAKPPPDLLPVRVALTVGSRRLNLVLY